MSALTEPVPAVPRTVVVPVQLGCCPETPRCLLCASSSAHPDAATVAAMVDHYRHERAGPDDLVRLGFYGGPPPTDELLEATGGLPFIARVRPDLLTRADAARLQARGAIGIELDVLCFDDEVLRVTGRRYRQKRVDEQIEGITASGLAVGIVLAPGLPGTDHDSAVRDAEHAVRRGVRFARLHPVVVLADSGLRELHMDGRYVPLELGQAITTCRAMMDVLEAADVDVVRVGQNPSADELGRAVAGPRHSALRQLVQARRFLEVLRRDSAWVPMGAELVIACNPADETAVRGPFNRHLRAIRAERGLSRVTVQPDPMLIRREIRLTVETP